MKMWVWLVLVLSVYAQDSIDASYNVPVDVQPVSDISATDSNVDVASADLKAEDVIGNVDPVFDTEKVVEISDEVAVEELIAEANETFGEAVVEQLQEPASNEPAQEAVAEIALYVNDQPFPELLNIAAQPVSFGVYVPPGFIIENVEIYSDNPVMQSALEAFLVQKFYDSQVSEYAAADVSLPTGEADVQVIVTYKDFNLEERQVIFASHLVVEGDNNMIDWLPDEIAQDIIAEEVLLQPLPDELTYEDLDVQDLQALGISPDDFIEGIEQLEDAEQFEEAGNVEAAEQMREEAGKELPLIEQVAQEEEIYIFEEAVAVVEEYKEELEGNIHPAVEVGTRVFKVKKGNKEITKSKIHISVAADKQLKDGSVIVVIPKEIAQSAGVIDFSETPVILKDDPVVKWAFKNIPQDQHKDYTFTVDGDAQNFDTIAVAAATKPSMLARFISWFIRKFS